MMLINFFGIVSLCFVGVFSSSDFDPDNELGPDNSRGSCLTDRDCAESDYCTRNQVCYPCFSCEKMNQQKSVKRCAKGVQDCGLCLPGYSESSYIGKNRKKVCVPIVTLAEPMTAEDKNDFIPNPSTMIGMTILAILTMIALISWRCYATRSPNIIQDSWTEMGLGPRTRCSNGASLPPPSYEDAQKSESGSVAYSFQLRISETPEKQTTAIPFQIPFGENIISLANSNHENSTANNNQESLSNVPVNESETSFQPTAFDIHDESTQPSMWTPGTAYFMNQNIDETDGVDEPAKDEKVSPPNKRRKTEEKENKSNDS